MNEIQEIEHSLRVIRWMAITQTVLNLLILFAL